MIVDTSALAAILFSAPERAGFIERGDRNAAPKLSMVTLVEATLVVDGWLGSMGGGGLDALLHDGGIAAVAVDRAQAELAREAFPRFGKGRHPVGLEFGDCFAYALVKATGEPQLCTGDGFPRTELRLAE